MSPPGTDAQSADNVPLLRLKKTVDRRHLMGYLIPPLL
jgi:hypothetical protein